MRIAVNKDNVRPISAHFKAKEFGCPCGCYGEIETNLIEKLEEVRVQYSKPIRITSGFRCQAYQDDLKARGYETAIGISPHTLGIAADICPYDGKDVDVLAKLCENTFKATGVGATFVHVDLRNDKERRWTYTKRT